MNPHRAMTGHFVASPWLTPTMQLSGVQLPGSIPHSQPFSLSVGVNPSSNVYPVTSSVLNHQSLYTSHSNRSKEVIDYRCHAPRPRSDVFLPSDANVFLQQPGAMSFAHQAPPPPPPSGPPITSVPTPVPPPPSIPHYDAQQLSPHTNASVHYSVKQSTCFSPYATGSNVNSGDLRGSNSAPGSIAGTGYVSREELQTAGYSWDSSTDSSKIDFSIDEYSSVDNNFPHDNFASTSTNQNCWEPKSDQSERTQQQAFCNWQNFQESEKERMGSHSKAFVNPKRIRTEPESEELSKPRSLLDLDLGCGTGDVDYRRQPQFPQQIQGGRFPSFPNNPRLPGVSFPGPPRHVCPPFDLLPRGTPPPVPPPPPMLTIKAPRISVLDLLEEPGRAMRPPKICVVFRGLPGSGKSHLAKMIKEKEVEKSGVVPRVFCLDDYFMVEEEENEGANKKSGRKLQKAFVYDYDAAMEPVYRKQLLKTFRKTLEDGLFDFVMLDCINQKIAHFDEFWQCARNYGFQVYVSELIGDVHSCARKNIHQKTLDYIQTIAKGWEDTPPHFLQLDCTSLLQEASIEEVDMEDHVEEKTSEEVIADIALPSTSKDLVEREQVSVSHSKWDHLESNEEDLDKLDGMIPKRKRKRSESESDKSASAATHKESYADELRRLFEEGKRTKSNTVGANGSQKKRVRWADVEALKNHEREKAVGFVVGKTNWEKLSEDYDPSSALEQTKYI